MKGKLRDTRLGETSAEVRLRVEAAPTVLRRDGHCQQCRHASAPNPQILCLRWPLPGADEDHHAPVTADGQGVSPGAQAQPDDCGFSGVGGDHLGAFGGGVSVPSQAGVDVTLTTFAPSRLRCGSYISGQQTGPHPTNGRLYLPFFQSKQNINNLFEIVALF